MLFTNTILPLSLVFPAAMAVSVWDIHVGQHHRHHSPSFLPQEINPAVGDTVIFHLYPKHNVVEGNFSTPCHYMTGGFASGPYKDSDKGKKKFVVNVTSTDPVYYYSVGPHGKECENGMVGGWNTPTTGNTVAQYKQNAKKAGKAGGPGKTEDGQLLDDKEIVSLTSTDIVAHKTRTRSHTHDQTATPTATMTT